MAKMKSVNFDSTFFLQIGIGIFFFILGLFGLLPNVQESIFSLSDTNLALEVIFGILEIACSMILVLGLFMYSKRSLLSKASLIILVFWALRIFISKFVFGFAMSGGMMYFDGGFPQWILSLIVELILLIVIFDIKQKYSK
jgi:hypothetical protein